MSTPGPTRIILIRSGRYDLAEITLGNSVHLVGHNNVGKTSAIATLQFLYIASFKEMHFSRPWEESVRYYFQSDRSYILFETMTGDGRYVTFGLRGRGQLGGYQVDRFAYTGRYAREDFILDDNRVRSFEEVKSLIVSDRFFKLLEPSDIRAAVVGESKIPEINMGIVPLKDPSRYGDFVYLFKNLLRLSRLSQQDIKDTLLTVYKKTIRHATEVDLSSEYGDIYTALQAEKDKLHNLKQIAPTINRLKELKNQREQARRDLPSMYAELVSQKARRQTELQESLDKTTGRINEIESAINGMTDRLADLQTESQRLSGDAAIVGQWINEFDETAKEVSNFLPDLEAQARQNLAREIEELSRQIYTAGDPEELSRKIEALTVELQRKTEQRDKYHSLFGTRLQQHASVETLTNLGKIFNPALLRIPVEEGSITINDEKALKAALVAAESHLDNEKWAGAGVTVPLSLVAPTPLPDMEALNAEIRDTEHRLEEAKKAHQIAVNMAALKEQHRTLQGNLKEAEERQARYDAHQKKRPEHPQKTAQLKTLKNSLAEIQQSHKKLLEENGENIAIRLRLNASLVGIREEQTTLDKIRPAAPQPDWPAGAVDPDWPADVTTLFKLYTETYNGYQGIEASMADQLRQAEGQYSDGFDGIGMAEKIDAAIEILESMKDQEKAYSTHLGNVIKSMQAAFQRLFEALQGLRDAADSFNKQIGRVSISNLRQLSLDIIEHTQITKSYRAIVDMQKADLFSNLVETETAIKEIYEVIRQRPTIKLSDWFGVRFVIEAADGTQKRYDDLSVIESNGTTMAIKTLVNMVLIRALMKDRRAYRIPFYIDEATQVDTPNLKEVVSLANEMGFCPVLASTAPVSVAEYLNMVEITPDQRANIDPRRCIHRKAL